MGYHEADDDDIRNNSSSTSSSISTSSASTPYVAHPHLPSSSRADYRPIASRYGMMSSSNEGLMGSSSSSSGGGMGSFIGMGSGSHSSGGLGSSSLETWTGAPAPHPGVLSFLPVVLAKLAVVLWLIALLKPHVYTREVQLSRFDLTVNTGMYEVCYAVQGDAIQSLARVDSNNVRTVNDSVSGSNSSSSSSSSKSSHEAQTSKVVPVSRHPPKHRYGHSPHHPFRRRPLSDADASASASASGSSSLSAPSAGVTAVNGVPIPLHVQDRNPNVAPHPVHPRPPLPRPVVAPVAVPVAVPVAAPVAVPVAAPVAVPVVAPARPGNENDNTTSIDVGDCRPLDPDCTVMLDDSAWPAPVPWSWRGLVVSSANCGKFVAAREMTVAMSTLLFLSGVSYVAWLCTGSPMGASRYRHTTWASVSVLLAAVSTVLSIAVIAIVAVVFQREHTIPLNRARYDYSMYLLIAGMLASLLATASMTVARVRKPNYYV